MVAKYNSSSHLSPRKLENYGSGTLNANIGKGNQNNNNANGKQFIGQNQYFSDSSMNKLDLAKSLNEEKKRCLGSLSFATIDTRRQDIGYAHEDTCKWLFQTVQFQQWLRRRDLRSHNGVLWIKGKPGAGKSTLMKYTWLHRQEFFEDHTIAAYFFNARGDPLEKTIMGMLRSLTYQLLDNDPLLYERFLPMFRNNEKKHKAWDWREAELKDFLLLETKTPQTKPLLFLIDALDECSELHVRDVVKFLEDLSINAAGSDVTLNICLSSRHYPTISMKKNLELVVEEKKEHDEDIARYVCDNLTKRDKDVEKEILEKASGVFMWVKLVVAMLNRAYDEGKVEAMHTKLSELPGDLEQVFETLLNKDNPDKHETLFLLQCVLFARRALKPEELYFAMIAGTDAQKLGAWNQSVVTSEDIWRRITSSSKGLIEMRKGEDKTVQFIHETVNDFLLRNQRLQTLDPTLESEPVGVSHDRLRGCCMSYIMMSGLSPIKERSQVPELSSIYPFLEYSSTYVFDHAEEAQERGIVQNNFVHSLEQQYENFQRLRRFHNAFEENPFVKCNESVTLLYILLSHGCCELVKALLLEKQIDVNARGGIHGSALQVAAGEGQEKIVGVLLDRGADVNMQGGFLGNALQAAAVGGKENVVEILLDKGADVNIQGGLFGSALQEAAVKGKENIVEILLDKGADVNIQGGLFGSALQVAAVKGKENIVEILLDKGADVNIQGGLFGSALQVAVVKEQEQIMEILLDNGADVNIQGGLYGSALQAAVVEAQERIVEILLDKGANVNIQGGLYGSALQAAVVKEQWQIVKILLENGADLNVSGGSYSSMLQTAVAEGEEGIVEMLLDEETDINTLGRVYGSMLQAAAAKGKGEIVAMLFDRGADVNASGGVFGSALQAAAAKGEGKIMTMLLDKGADVNASGGVFGSALQAAAIGGDKEMVGILLDERADVNGPGGPCGSALEAAAFEGKEEIVEMLLGKGADINIPGRVYGSALQAAVFKEEEKIVAMLLDKGADVNASGGLLGSALLIAMIAENEDIVMMLLGNGAEFQAKERPFNNGSMPDTASDESSCGKDDPHGDGTVNTGQKLSKFVFIITTLCAVFFIVRLSFQRKLTFDS
ncbi:Ankyrin repeat-containing domain protein [Elaphomyces granulatus]